MQGKRAPSWAYLLSFVLFWAFSAFATEPGVAEDAAIPPPRATVVSAGRGIFLLEHDRPSFPTGRGTLWVVEEGGARAWIVEEFITSQLPIRLIKIYTMTPQGTRPFEPQLLKERFTVTFERRESRVFPVDHFKVSENEESAKVTRAAQIAKLYGADEETVRAVRKFYDLPLKFHKERRMPDATVTPPLIRFAPFAAQDVKLPVTVVSSTGVEKREITLAAKHLQPVTAASAFLGNRNYPGTWKKWKDVLNQLHFRDAQGIELFAAIEVVLPQALAVELRCDNGFTSNLVERSGALLLVPASGDLQSVLAAHAGVAVCGLPPIEQRAAIAAKVGTAAQIDPSEDASGIEEIIVILP